jgi:hypothetical protein
MAHKLLFLTALTLTAITLTKLISTALLLTALFSRVINSVVLNSATRPIDNGLTGIESQRHRGDFRRTP